MKEINWPQKLKYYYSKKQYPENCVEAANKMLAACQAAVEAAGLEYGLDEERLYSLMMNEFAQARNKGHTDLYIHGDAVNYVAHALKLAEKELIMRTKL